MTSASLRFITAAEPVDANLTHLGLPATAPPLSPARGPPQHDLAFDADPGFDLPAQAAPGQGFRTKALSPGTGRLTLHRLRLLRRNR